MAKTCVRPLLVAGPGAVVGAALGFPGLPWVVAAIAVAGVLVPRHAAVVLAAFIAGAAVRPGQESETWPRAPPALASCALSVLECGEDPFRRRAWCRGRRDDGAVVLCTWQGLAPRELLPGARIRVSGRFFVSPPAGNPGEREPRTPLRADLRSRDNVFIEHPAPPGLLRWSRRARRALARRLARVLPDDVARLSVALLLGIRSGLSDADRLRYERTGTMHMLAISGLHLIVLAGLVHGLLRRLGAGPRTAALATLVLAWAYVPLTGAATPVRRAVMVLTTYGIALVRGRRPDVWSALSGAALLLVLIEPGAARTVGFYLSFAASAGILLLARPWHARWGRRHRLLERFPAVRADRPVALRVRGYVLRALPVSLAAWLATQAIAAAAFGAVTPLAPLTNLFAAPFLALLLPLAALVAAGFDPCALPLTWAVRGLHALLDTAAELPCAYWFVAALPTAALVAWGTGVLLLRVRARPAIVCLAAAVCIGWRAAPEPSVSVHLFAVGHGQAALIRFDDGNVVLVDAGSRTRPGLTRRVLLPALRRLGVRRFHTVVCTHADADHWNALPALLARVPADRILGSPPLAERPLKRGETVHATRHARLSVLDAEGDGSKNDGSVALLLEVGRQRVLFPADREERGLHRLLKVGVPRCDVLVAPHHGARCTAALAFGLAARPRWLLVSTAAGFADAPTLRAYRGRVRQTCLSGCLVVRFDPLRVSGYRAPSPTSSTSR